MTVLTAKKLIVTATELNPEYDLDGNPSYGQYEFPVWEFENGCILVPDMLGVDYFFGDRGSIEPCGTAVVTDVRETGDVEEFTSSCLRRVIGENIKADYTIPQCAFQLIGRKWVLNEKEIQATIQAWHNDFGDELIDPDQTDWLDECRGLSKWDMIAILDKIGVEGASDYLKE